jgi:hypothetical protein
MNRTLALVAVAGALAVQIGCDDVSSSDLLTSGMWADVSVVAEGDGNSEVTAILRAGGALSTTFVELGPDDHLVATLGEESQELGQVSLGNIHSYVTTFDADAEDVDYLVAFERLVDAGAPDTTVSLPAPFAIDAPAVETFARGADALTVTWTPSGGSETMAISFDGECIAPYIGELSGDPGTYTLPAGTLQDISETPANCPVNVKVERIRSGDLDPAYGEGGTALGVQRRTIQVQSTP